MLLFLAGWLLLGPSPERVEAQKWLKDGQRHMGRERFEEAARAFRQAIELDPLLTLAHYGLGQAHMALKQYPAAVVAFGGARDAFHQAAARGLDERLQNESARQDRIRDLQDKIRDNQQRALPANSAEARQRDMRIQQWEVEIAALRRTEGISSIPETPAGLSLALGSAHFRNGQLADAEREYRAALDVQPRLDEARNNLAVVLLLTGRPADAKEQIEIAEKNGFQVAPGLKQDVEAALANSPAGPGR